MCAVSIPSSSNCRLSSCIFSLLRRTASLPRCASSFRRCTSRRSASTSCCARLASSCARLSTAACPSPSSACVVGSPSALAAPLESPDEDPMVLRAEERESTAARSSRGAVDSLMWSTRPMRPSMVISARALCSDAEASVKQHPEHAAEQD
eukprot:scaffold39126_cov66-Phaeocystis_antarctica.AAC.5